MPGNRSNSQSNLKTIVINDFTPGINNQAFSTLTNSTVPFTRTPSKNQVTSSANTYGCIGLPNGGLLLGPTVDTVTSPYLTFPSGSSNTVITGIYNSGPFSYITTAQTNGGVTQTSLYLDSGIVISKSLGANGTNDWPAFPFLTSIYNTGPYAAAVYTSPVQSSVAHSYWATASTSGDFSGSMGRDGYAIPANGRVWLLESVIGVSGLFPQIFNCVSYTDPSIPASDPNTTFGTQKTFIDYDDPTTFGAWGTVTSGETMLIKNSMGGVLVTGDIFNPNVTLAPSVMGTNGMLGQACLSPLGLVYRSYANGVWVWSGGANATKLSPQLDDSVWPENSSFYQTTAPKHSFSQAGLTYPFFNVQFINNCLFFDGGFFYSLTTNSWWRLPPYATSSVPSAIFAPCFYIPRYQSAAQFSAIYANGPAPANVCQTTDYSFDVSVGSYSFTPPTGYYGSFWESNVIQPTRSIIEVQEVYLLMQGKGTLSVACVGVGGQQLSFKQVTVSANAGYEQIKVSGKFETDGLILQIGWTNSSGDSNSTPIIDSIEIDYVERFPAPVAN